MIDQTIGQNKECSVNIRLIRGEVAILAGLNSLDVYYSNIVPEARNRLPRVSVRNSLLGLVPQTYLLVNVYTQTRTHTHKGYRLIPMHFTKILRPKPGDTTKQRPRDTANPQIFSLKNSIERQIDQSLITRFVACRSISMVRR